MREKPPLPGAVTRHLQRWSEGDPQALDAVIEETYGELRKAARRFLSGDGRTLRPTALVNEIYPRLVTAKQPVFQDRNQFLWFAGTLMRQVVIQHVRTQGREKRGGAVQIQSLDVDPALPGREDLSQETLMAVDDVITQLERLDPRQAQITVMRFYAGMTLEEMADALKVSTATVKREWAMARRFIGKQLQTSDAEA